MSTRRLIAILGTALVFSAGKVSVSYAQEQGTGPKASESASEKDKPTSKTDAPPEANAVMKTSEGSRPGLVGRFVGDQQEIWTSPGRLQFSDTEWLVPLSGISAGLFVTDRDFSNHLSQNPTTISHYKTLSNAGVAALVGGGAGMWLLGHASHNEHWSETGFLAGEAALNSVLMVEGLKYSLRRDRPIQGDGSGSFFQSGGTSFPSGHAATAWSIAGVVAHEYPGPFTKIMAYGLASLVSVSRVKAHQHFPSDVFVGGVIGNLVAQDIYTRHHNPDLGGGVWRSIGEIVRGEGDSSPAKHGSSYVPLDSWVYPAFEQLMALGYVESGLVGMKPWSRLECARLTDEAGGAIQQALSDGRPLEDLAVSLQQTLDGEFASELSSEAGSFGPARVELESVYSRLTSISGPPLTDGFHFGQTISYDFGRPFRRGTNEITGSAVRAEAGPLSFY